MLLVSSLTRTEDYSGRVIRMLCQPVTRTEGYSGRVIWMLRQLVGLFSVERAIVKFDVFFSRFEEYYRRNAVANHQK